MSHSEHDNHLLTANKAELSLLELLKDVFAFGGGDDTFENVAKKKGWRCIHVLFVNEFYTVFNVRDNEASQLVLKTGSYTGIGVSVAIVSIFLKRTDHYRGSPQCV